MRASDAGLYVSRVRRCQTASDRALAPSPVTRASVFGLRRAQLRWYRYRSSACASVCMSVCGCARMRMRDVRRASYGRVNIGGCLSCSSIVGLRARADMSCAEMRCQTICGYAFACAQFALDSLRGYRIGAQFVIESDIGSVGLRRIRRAAISG